MHSEKYISWRVVKLTSACFGQFFWILTENLSISPVDSEEAMIGGMGCRKEVEDKISKDEMIRKETLMKTGIKDDQRAQWLMARDRPNADDRSLSYIAAQSWEPAVGDTD